jgi:hypothetical protein
MNRKRSGGRYNGLDAALRFTCSHYFPSNYTGETPLYTKQKILACTETKTFLSS